MGFDPVKGDGMILAVGAPPGNSLAKLNFRPRSGILPVKSASAIKIEQKYANLDSLFEIAEKKGIEGDFEAQGEDFLSGSSNIGALLGSTQKAEVFPKTEVKVPPIPLFERTDQIYNQDIISDISKGQTDPLNDGILAQSPQVFFTATSRRSLNSHKSSLSSTKFKILKVKQRPESRTSLASVKQLSKYSS
jgi:hypothetical protein